MSIKIIKGKTTHKTNDIVEENGVTVRITSVRICPLNEVTGRDCLLAGYKDKKKLMKALGVKDFTTVSTIKFKSIETQAVEWLESPVNLEPVAPPVDIAALEPTVSPVEEDIVETDSEESDVIEEAADPKDNKQWWDKS